MNRRLGNFEHALTITGQIAPFAVAAVLRFENGPDPETLGRALAVMQRRQPVLRVRIVRQGGGYFFETPAEVPAVPLQIVQRVDGEQWRDAAVQVLNTPVEINRAPLLRCTYFYQDGVGAPAELVLGYHHAIMDASSGIMFYHQLLALCAGELDEEDLSPLPLQPAAEGLFPGDKRGVGLVGSLMGYFLRQMVDEVGYRRKLGDGRRQPIYPSAQCRILTQRLDKESTQALGFKSRRQRVSIFTALAAAMVMAVHKHLYDNRAMPLRAIMFADLRPYLRPPVSNDYLGCYISMIRHTVYVEEDPDFWSTAGAFQESIARSGRRKEKFPAHMMSKQLMKTLIRSESFRMSTTAISYSGPARLEANYGPIRVTGFHAFVSNNRLGPEYSAYAKILFGELSWDFLYLDSDMDQAMAEMIAGETNQILKRAAGGE